MAGWITGRVRREGSGPVAIETASSELDCTRDSASQRQRSKSRVSEMPRNPAQRGAVSRDPRGARQRVFALA